MTSPYCCVVRHTVACQVSQRSVTVCHQLRVFPPGLGRRHVRSGLHWLRNALSHTARALELCVGLNSLWIRIHIGLFLCVLELVCVLVCR
jgi:hypothetical protein